MATIINNPPSNDNSGGPVMIIIVLVILAVLAYLGYVYGLPALKNAQVRTPEIKVPSTIDVNVNQK